MKCSSNYHEIGAERKNVKFALHKIIIHEFEFLKLQHFHTLTVLVISYALFMNAEQKTVTPTLRCSESIAVLHCSNNIVRNEQIIN